MTQLSPEVINTELLTSVVRASKYADFRTDILIPTPEGLLPVQDHTRRRTVCQIWDKIKYLIYELRGSGILYLALQVDLNDKLLSQIRLFEPGYNLKTYLFVAPTPKKGEFPSVVFHPLRPGEHGIELNLDLYTHPELNNKGMNTLPYTFSLQDISGIGLADTQKGPSTPAILLN